MLLEMLYDIKHVRYYLKNCWILLHALYFCSNISSIKSRDIQSQNYCQLSYIAILRGVRCVLSIKILSCYLDIKNSLPFIGLLLEWGAHL